ncbi:hypothetical protein AB0B66_40640 [Catellatospora sp. NPDC049111]|uniref:hypothetical protein n=1 Tax=Catellatospora sp. NPDC049111 TaxID=3155271 RepID=UPI00340C919B
MPKPTSSSMTSTTFGAPEWRAQDLGALLSSGLAQTGGDDHMEGYAYVRRALISLYHDDAAQTVELARKAQESRFSARIRGLAAQREAQGHAIGGNHRACMLALDRAAALLADAAAARDDEIVLGTSAVVDPVAMATGWRLHELGRTKEAAGVLSAECARIHPAADRAQTGSRTIASTSLPSEPSPPLFRARPRRSGRTVEPESWTAQTMSRRSASHDLPCWRR